MGVKDLPFDFAEELVPAGTVLLRRMRPGAAAIYVESGRVSLGLLGKRSEAISEVIESELAVVKGPCWLNASAAVLDAPSAFDAVTQTEVRLRRMPPMELRAWLNSCALGARSLVIDLAQVNYSQTERAVICLDKDALARCAEWLLAHAILGQGGRCSVHFARNKRSLAEELDIVPETLSRKLRQLRELRLVSGQGKHIVLLDCDGLAAIAGLETPYRIPVSPFADRGTPSPCKGFGSGS